MADGYVFVDLTADPTNELPNGQLPTDDVFGVLHAILNGRGTQPLRVSLASQNNVTLHHLLAILSVPAANVRALDLSSTNVSDQEIETMARMCRQNMLRLREIRLADVNVTETGLQWLRAIPGLEIVRLRGFTNEGVQQLVNNNPPGDDRWTGLRTLGIYGHKNKLTRGLFTDICQQCPNLKTFEINECELDGITFDDIKALMEPLVHLTTLTVNTTQLVDRGLVRRIIRCNHLTEEDFQRFVDERVEVLVLGDTNVTNSMLQIQSQSQSVKSFGTRNNDQITNAAIQFLSRIRTLEAIKFANCPGLTDELFNGFTQECWPRLDFLHLEGRFTQNVFAPLHRRSFENLKTLSLRRSQILESDFGDGTIACAPDFPCLGSLTLFGGSYTDNALTIAAEKWRTVKALTIYHIPQFDGSTLPQVMGPNCNWNGLTNLSLHGVNVAGENFLIIHGISQLESLTIQECPNIGDEHIPENMSNCWARLLSFSVNGIGFSNDVVRRAVPLQELRSLGLGSKDGPPNNESQNFNDEWLHRVINEGRDCPWRKLRHLHLCGINFTDRVFQRLREVNFTDQIWPNLTSLYLDNPIHFSEAVIDRLPQGIWPRLSALTIHMNPNPDPPNFLRRILQWFFNPPSFFNRIQARWGSQQFELNINLRPDYPWW